MRVLITGGAGFIGSHLTDYYLARGDEVTIIDDLSTGLMENVAHLEGCARFTAHYDSVENLSLLDASVQNADLVFHLAAAVGVKRILEDPIGSMHRNIKCVEAVLEKVDKHKKPILIASTSEVYGKSTKHMFDEDDDLIFGGPTKLRWNYACSKAIDEFMSMAYYKHHSLPVVITRFFNTVGPRQSKDYGMVIPVFMEQALAGRDITIFGDGTQTRCFCHVKDVVDAIAKIMARGKAAYGQIFNIGDNREISILDLANKILHVTGSSSRIVTIPYAKVYDNNGSFEDILRRMPDLRRIQKLIGFKAKYTLNDILHDVKVHMIQKLDQSLEQKVA